MLKYQEILEKQRALHEQRWGGIADTHNHPEGEYRDKFGKEVLDAADVMMLEAELEDEKLTRDKKRPFQRPR